MTHVRQHRRLEPAGFLGFLLGRLEFPLPFDLIGNVPHDAHQAPTVE